MLPPSTRTQPIVVLTPGLRRLLAWVLILFGLLAINSLYLVGVAAAEALTGKILQNYFYLMMFLAHLVLGLMLLVPALVFAVRHLRRARRRPNRYAIRAGLGLFSTSLLLFATGVLLTRFGFFEVNDPQVRLVAYWIHLLAPLLVAWLFVLHRLAGPRLRWRAGAIWSAGGVLVTLISLGWHLADRTNAAPLARAFAPALSQVPADRPIPAEHLMDDATCAECHADIAEQHERSMHRLSSFNNPAYRFSIEDTRAFLKARDGNVRASRLCAACHDQVPLFSGRFDDPEYDPDADPGAQAGITCLGCHAIAAINSPRGNGDYRLVDPPRYPFAFSDNPLLSAINRQLIKAKPIFHKKTLLKPVHRRILGWTGCSRSRLTARL